MSDYKYLSFETINHTGLVTLRRPDMMNALNKELTLELHHVLENISGLFPSIRVVVLTGEGNGFCSGADLSRMSSQGSENRKNSVSRGRGGRRIQELAAAIRAIPQPVIAAVNGAAVGAGLSIALASDIRIASEDARFSAIFVRRGLVPDTAASATITSIAGHGVAAEMALTGKIYDAQWAGSHGLVNRIVPPGKLMEDALSTAEEISSNPPLAVKNTKKLMREVMLDWHQVISNEDSAGDPLYDTDDQAEAIAAFLQKRTPNYRGK